MSLIGIIAIGLLSVAALAAVLWLRQRPSAAEAATDELPRAVATVERASPVPTEATESADAAEPIDDHDTAYELASEGKLEEAARLAMQRKNWADATGYYQELGQHGNAAYCARRDGNMELAAELYERAGDLDNAARCWDKHGDAAKARRLRAKIGGERRAKAHEAISSRESLPPKQLAALIDAALASGDDDRIAQLYAEAGEHDKAAKHWIKAARRSRAPTRYLDRIRSMSPVQAHNFLEMETKAYPPSAKSAELHYQLALSYITLGAPDGALDILERLVSIVGDYKDAREMLADPDAVRARSEEAMTPNAD